MPTKRTTLRSSGGKKLYAVRDAQGKFEDIQTYKRAHGQDIRRKSKAELEAAAKKTAAKSATKKSATKKSAARKSTSKKSAAKKSAAKKSTAASRSRKA